MFGYFGLPMRHVRDLFLTDSMLAPRVPGDCARLESDLDVTAKMTVRALYFFVVGFSGLFAMQGCGGGDTTAAAAATTASP